MIPVFKPSYGEEELEALREPFRTGWLGLGPKTKEFEDRFAEFIGVPHATGVNSATAALHLALMIAGVEGKEVITTSMTFVSTNHAILYNNGIPVFADIEPDRRLIVGREMTKMHEEYIEGRSADIYENFNARTKIYGEISILISGNKKS